MSSFFNLENKIAVITGGLGQLGQEYAKSFLNAGSQVVILDLQTDSSRLESTVKQGWEEKKVLLIDCDITQKDQIHSALKEIESQWETPHILINNAALDSPPSASVEENGPFEDYPESSLNKILDVNIKGTVFACQVFGGAMANKGRGSIVNISSIYGVVSPQQDIYEYKAQGEKKFYKPVAYSISKSAVLNLTRYLAAYWGEKGVRVNTLTPAGIFNNQDKEFLNEYESRMPIGRMADPSEMSSSILFLASEASSYMNGSNLIADGGWTCQ